MAAVKSRMPGHLRVGSNLRRLRLGAHLTQVELAEQLGMPQKTVSRLERGLDRPRTDTLDRFAEFFEVDVAELLRPEENADVDA